MTLIRSGGRCPVCGADHASCGPPTTTSGLDLPELENPMAGPLKTYDVVHNGHRTRLKLNERDARAFGVYEEPKPEQKARTPQNKGRTTPNK